MKLIFLGTGAAEGIPAMRCRCERCRQARVLGCRELRQNSGLYIQGDRGERILIDCPSQTKARLNDFGVDDGELSHLLVTHYHQDHTNGFYFLAGNTAKNGVTVDSPLSVFLSRDSRDSLVEQFHPREAVSFHIIRHMDRFRTGEISVTALETNHLAFSQGDEGRVCLGFLLESSSSTVAYLADASRHLPSDTEALLREMKPDCLILECTFAGFPENTRHLDIPAVLDLKERIPAKRIILTHISHRNLGHGELTALMEKHGIETAWDGMTAEIQRD